MTFQEENDFIFNNLLDSYFFKGWRNGDSTKSVEFIIRRKCNLACKYCYYTNHGKELIPDSLDDVNTSITNVKRILDFFKEHKIYPRDFSIFGGEDIKQSQYLWLFDILYDYCKSLGGKKSISFPMNPIFLMNDSYYQMLIEQKKQFEEIGTYISYSISTDGKYCDPYSRPAVNGANIYTDAYYERVAQFARETNSGFHPMIAAENIKYWIENFDWYINFLKEIYPEDYISALYLLDVRNDNWTEEHLADLRKLILHIGRYLGGTLKPDELMHRLSRSSVFNLYNIGASIVGRGLTCSLQSILHIRCADASIVSCHRLSYQDLLGGKFDFEKNHIEALNHSVYLATLQVNYKNMPVCNSCDINTFCNGSCLGANREATGSMFVPSPSMCRMKKVLRLAMIESFKELGIYDRLLVNLKAMRASSDLDCKDHLSTLIVQIEALGNTIDCIKKDTQ